MSVCHYYLSEKLIYRANYPSKFMSAPKFSKLQSASLHFIYTILSSPLINYKGGQKYCLK